MTRRDRIRRWVLRKLFKMYLIANELPEDTCHLCLGACVRRYSDDPNDVDVCDQCMGKGRLSLLETIVREMT